MTGKILKRLLSFFLTLLVVSLVVFAAVSLAPGDSSSFVFSEDASEAVVSSYREGLGQGRSLALRYLLFMKAFFTFDWGCTISGLEVAEAVASRLPVTLGITLISLSLAFCFSLWLSLKTIGPEGVGWSRIHHLLVVLFLAFPSFLVALGLVLVFGVYLKLFPIAGYISPKTSIWGCFRTLFLPSLTMAILHSSLMMRLFKEEFLHNVEKPFAAVALAKGVKRKDLPRKHILKPSLVLVLAVLSEGLASSLLGSAVVESVFALPGIGSFMVNSALSRDVTTTSILVLLSAFLVSLVYLVTDLLGYLVDPRKGRDDEKA